MLLYWLLLLLVIWDVFKKQQQQQQEESTFLSSSSSTTTTATTTTKKINTMSTTSTPPPPPSTTTVDLAALRDEIDSIGTQIKEKKTAGAPKEELDPLVASLVAKKKDYADANGGIGVDGLPVGLSKAERKKLLEKEKAAAVEAAAAADGGSGSGNAAPTAENAAKKAAKKAEKAAKKAAHKAAPAPSAVPGGGNSEAAAAAATPSPPPPKKAAAVAAAAAAASGGAPTANPTTANLQVPPMTLMWNPNTTQWHEKPMVALAVACLTNTDVDLNLVGDRRVVGSQPLLGLEEEQRQQHEGGGGGGGAVVVVAGDLAAARYLLNRACHNFPHNKANELGGAPSSLAQTALVDTWVDYAQSMSQVLPPDRRLRGLTMTLEHALQQPHCTTYLVGHALSLADVALFQALGWPCAAQERHRLLHYLIETADRTLPLTATARWVRMVASHPALQKATQLAVGVGGSDEAVFDVGSELEPLPEGMALLEGATPGHVVTRFPPEPSGYLHVGHAKALLLNDFYANRYRGRLIARFDDTNPSKEKEEFQQSIIEDMGLLGVKFDVLTYTSDYIGTIRGYALDLMERGLAYMDDTPQEQMKEERANRIESKHRTMDSVQAKELFALMCSGSPDGAAWCLRAKINMQSDNGTMRDPVLYRQNLTPHHRTGTTYKAYPTYDLACPIVDSLEGVTHALRTTEYNDRDEQYQWILKALGLRRVRIHGFARMNFQYTVLSKRKLTWFVNQGLVTGWDDARFPTVRGVIRRGVNVSALKQYIYSQGASRRVVNMVWSKFWAENKKEIDKTAKRFMAIDATQHVTLKVVNAPKVEDHAYLTTPFHPKDPSLGSRVLRIAQDVLLEKVDVDGLQVGEQIVLMRWGVVEITKVEQDGTVIEGNFVPDGDFKACKRKLTWIANVPDNLRVVLTEFDNLVTKEKLEEGDKFEDYVNKTTVASTKVIADAGLKALQKHETIQLERRGFYRVDKEYVNGETESGTMVLYMIPDGKSKSMGGLVGQLAHH